MEGQGEAVAIHTRPEERPDWQQPLGCREVGYRIPAYVWSADRFQTVRTQTPRSDAALLFDPGFIRRVYCVKAGSRPHPWPESKQQAPPEDFLMKRFTEQT